MRATCVKHLSAICLLFLVLELGCRCDSEQNGPSPVPSSWKDLATASKPYANSKLRILGEDLPPLHSLERLRSEFSGTAGVEIDIDFKNHSKVIQSILEGALSNEYKYDVIFVPHKELGRLVGTGSILPMSMFAGQPALKNPSFKPEEQFFQPFWTEVSTYKGEWYAMPLYLGGSVVVYRKDLIESPEEQERFRTAYPGAHLAEPTTLEEWRRLAEFFYRRNEDPPMYGITLLMSDESLWYNWQSILFAMNGNVLDAKHGWEYGDIVVNSPEAVAATDLYRELSKYCPPDASSYSWGLGIAKQQAGVSFMTLLQYDVVAEFEDPEKTQLAGKFGYFIPRTEAGDCASQLESWVAVIPASARHPEAAWLFLQWMMDKEVQLRMHLEGNISPRKSTYEDPRVQAMPATGAILESLDSMVPKPTIPEADAIQDIITRRLQSILAGSASTKDALDAAARDIEERLRGRAKLRYPVE